jgi:hypothetical protein
MAPETEPLDVFTIGEMVVKPWLEDAHRLFYAGLKSAGQWTQ